MSEEAVALASKHYYTSVIFGIFAVIILVGFVAVLVLIGTGIIPFDEKNVFKFNIAFNVFVVLNVLVRMYWLFDNEDRPLKKFFFFLIMIIVCLVNISFMGNLVNKTETTTITTTTTV